MSGVTLATGPLLRRVVVRGARVVWVGASALAVAAGIAGATFLLGWLATIGLFLLVAASGWLWSLLTWLFDAGPSPLRLRTPDLVPAALVVSGVGLLDVLGLAALPVAAVLLLTHPSVRRRLRAVVGPERWARLTPLRGWTIRAREPAATPVPQPDEPTLVVTDELTLGDLCEAWRSSYVALQRSRTAASRLRAVEMRELYLDDLERRLGDDFARWMESVPKAMEDPRVFLRGHEPTT
jgi:hypothetical protein